MTKTQKYTVDALEDNKDQFAVYRCVDVAALEAELSAARGERDSICELYDLTCEKYDKLQAENAQLKARIEALEGALKDTVRRASNLSPTS